MKTETFLAQAPYAIAAIANHMVEHQLPAPMSIDVIGFDQVIRIRLHGTDAQSAWVRTLVVDREVNDAVTHEAFDGGYRTTWTVRLPDTGVVFEVVGFRTVALPSLVSA